MRFIGRNSFLWLMTLLLIAGVVSTGFAETTEVTEIPGSSTDSVLVIEPKHCVLQSEQELCRTQVTISWQSEKPQNYCLFEEGDELSLACWEAAVRGATRIRYASDESTTYQLKTADLDVVSSVTLRVSRVVKGRRKTKKRQGRLWSFP